MDLTKIDFKRDAKELYAPPRRPVLVDVPRFQFLMVDGCGRPGGSEFEAAVGLLYTAAYVLKFSVKRTVGLDWVVAPLEGLWPVAPDGAFDASEPTAWRWTLMIRQPDEIGAEQLEQARAQASRKFAPELAGRLRLEPLMEGRCAQVMHVGPYEDEGPTVEALRAFIAAQGYAPCGPHHEIYLSDPQRTAPDRMHTILRQPVRPPDPTGTNGGESVG